MPYTENDASSESDDDETEDALSDDSDLHYDPPQLNTWAKLTDDKKVFNDGVCKSRKEARLLAALATCHVAFTQHHSVFASLRSLSKYHNMLDEMKLLEGVSYYIPITARVHHIISSIPMKDKDRKQVDGQLALLSRPNITLTPSTHRAPWLLPLPTAILDQLEAMVLTRSHRLSLDLSGHRIRPEMVLVALKWYIEAANFKDADERLKALGAKMYQINLSHMSLERIEPSFFETLSHIQHLDLSYNSLRSVPYSFMGLNLRSLLVKGVRFGQDYRGIRGTGRADLPPSLLLSCVSLIKKEHLSVESERLPPHLQEEITRTNECALCRRTVMDSQGSHLVLRRVVNKCGAMINVEVVNCSRHTKPST